MKPSPVYLRVAAAIIDSFLVGLLWYYFIEEWGHADTAGALTTASMGADKVLTGMPAVALMVLTALYWIVPEWVSGATLGKLALGLLVSTLDGGPISFWQSFKRNLLRLVDFFPFYLTGFLTAKLTPLHQRIGDLWAHTIVVRKKDAKQTR